MHDVEGYTSTSALRDVSELTTYLASDHVRQFDDHLTFFHGCMIMKGPIMFYVF
jgi:hypothetical protein